MSFKVEAFQNRHLAPGTTRVNAIVSVTADADLKAVGGARIGGATAPLAPRARGFCPMCGDARDPAGARYCEVCRFDPRATPSRIHSEARGIEPATFPRRSFPRAAVRRRRERPFPRASVR